MKIKSRISKTVTILLSATVLAVSLYVPMIALADTVKVFDYNSEDIDLLKYDDVNFNRYGLYKVKGLEINELGTDAESKELTDALFDYSQIADVKLSKGTRAQFGIENFANIKNDNGKLKIDNGMNANRYVDYKVAPGTQFSAVFKAIWRPNIVGFCQVKDFSIKLQGSNNGSDWTDISALTFKKGEVTKNEDISADPYVVTAASDKNTYNYIRVLWPQKANDSYTAHDTFGLTSVVVSDPNATGDDGKLYNEEAYIYTQNTSVELSAKTMAQFGISSYGGNLNRTNKGIFDTEWTYQYNGGTDTHATYSVKSGTRFSAGFKVIWKPNLMGYIALKPFVIKLLGSSDGINWEEAANLTISSSDDINEPFTVEISAEKNKYSKIKILWPQKADNTCVGDDCIGLADVTFTDSIADMQAEYEDKDLDYTQNADVALSNETMEQFGISSYGGNLNRTNKGIFDTGWTYQYNGGTDTHAVYDVKSGTRFSADFNVIWKPNLTGYTSLKPFVIKLLGSNDGKNWEEAANLTVNNGEEIKNLYTAEITAEKNKYSKIKVLWPQKANNTYVGDDCIGLSRVVFTGLVKSSGESEDTDTFVKTSGMYLTVKEVFAETEAEFGKAYAVYNVSPSTKAKIVVARDAEKCAEMGDDWNVKFYESADAKEWTLINSVPETADGGIGKKDTYEIDLGGETNYLKVEFPQDCSRMPFDSGYGYIGIASVEIVRGDYIFNPYGSYDFEYKLNYTDTEEFSIKDNLKPGFCEDLYIYSVDSGQPLSMLPETGIVPSWSYWNGKSAMNNTTAWVTYCVEPGTAFQAEFAFDKKYFDISIEEYLGTDYMPKLYISSNGAKWQEYTDKFYRVTESSIRKNRAAAILTIEEIPENINLVKFEFPMDRDWVPVTGLQGNDRMELVGVSFTMGSGDFEEGEDIDTYKPQTTPEKNFNFDVDQVDKYDELLLWGLHQVESYGLIMPSGAYFANCGSSTRIKPHMIIPVKPETAFSAELNLRTITLGYFAEGEYDPKFYFSADGSNWDDVTSTYNTRTSAGVIAGFSTSDIFEVDKLPENVNFVKIELPNDRNYIGYTTSAGFTLQYSGNDYLGIKKLSYTSADANTFEHKIDNTDIYNKYEGGIKNTPDNTNKGILGLYDYSADSLIVRPYEGAVDGELGNRYLLQVDDAFIVGNKKFNPIYVTYNVKPGTSFEATMFASDSASSKLDVNMLYKAFVSADGKNWKKAPAVWSYDFTNELGLEVKSKVVINNVGNNTNYVKIEFPEYGDMSMNYPDKALNTGSYMFGLESVKATLVSYDSNYKRIEFNEIYSYESAPVISQEFTTTTPFFDLDEITTVEQNTTKEQITKKIPKKGKRVIEVPIEIPWVPIIGGGAAGVAAIAGLIIFLVVRKKKN